jgi:hypothetical protein
MGNRITEKMETMEKNEKNISRLWKTRRRMEKGNIEDFKRSY